jgi:hypothetical protein
MHFVIVGGSDAGIAAGLRAHELDPTCEITRHISARLRHGYHGSENT